MYDGIGQGLEAIAFANFASTAIIAVVVLMALLFIAKLSANRKSYDYRKYLADLYVAAMIRSQASKNDLDLDKEEKSFLATYKVHRKLAMKDIDDRIEASLNDDVNKTIESKTDKK